jgi:23S rRNA pseudouridine1911/1915/1917 synthase
VLRSHDPTQSWTAHRRVIEDRRVLVNGVVCVHEARRIAAGDRIQILAKPQPLPARADTLPLVYVDDDIVVVEKPAGIVTARRPEERHWPEARKRLWPTLDELVIERLVRTSTPAARKQPGCFPQRLWRVQRLDRDTSGLVLFARTQLAAERLIPQFAAHTVERIYHAVVHGHPQAQTIRTHLVRDRGDGVRGSARAASRGRKPPESSSQPAITHIQPLQSWGDLTLVECRLETGRTHQIRIHLSELGHPVCGDTRYRRRRDGVDIPDESGAPRLALHAMRLAFNHPRTDARMSFVSKWPADLAAWRV